MFPYHPEANQSDAASLNWQLEICHEFAIDNWKLKTMLRVGLTGSIGVGKSFVTGVLAELGCHVLDADLAAREVVAPGSKGLSAVVGAFGESILQNDGTLDRQQLGSLIFGDQSKRELLNCRMSSCANGRRWIRRGSPSSMQR
jgi:Dephospho-CoA kinase